MKNEEKIKKRCIKEKGYEYCIIYNNKGEIQEIKEDYYKDGFNLQDFLSKDMDSKKGVVKSRYSLGNIVEELSKHETQSNIHDLSKQLTQNFYCELNKIPVWFDRDFPGGEFMPGPMHEYALFNKRLIKDKKPFNQRLGKISRERYLNYMFNHESIHAILLGKINKLSGSKKGVDKLNAIYKYVKKNSEKKFYGFNNLDEFIAETFTSPDFQAHLNNLPLPDSLKSKPYVGGRFFPEKAIGFFTSLFRKKFEFDLNGYKSISDFVGDLVSNMVDSKIKITKLVGYNLEDN